MQRRRRGRRRGHADRRPDLLVQHDVRPGRPEARPGAAGGDDAATTASSRRRRSTTRATRWRPAASTAGTACCRSRHAGGRRPRRDRPGAAAGDAAADGGGGGDDRQRRRADAAVDGATGSVSPGGKTVLREPSARQIERVMSPQTAAELTGMMRAWSRRARGRRRTSETCRSPARPGRPRPESAGLNNAWFIAFAPAETPEDRRRGRDRAHARVRRHRRGTDRARRDRGVPRVKRGKVGRS